MSVFHLCSQELQSLLQAVNLSFCSPYGYHRDKTNSIHEQEWRKRYDQLSHLIAVEFRVGFE